MERTQEALLKWLAKATKMQIHNTQDLKSPKYLLALAEQISKMPSIQASQQNDKVEGWQTRYMNFKNINASVERYYKNVLKSSLPVGLPSVNLLQIAKGQDKDGLMALLTIFFIAAINSDTKENFIGHIMQLEEADQSQLVDVIKQKNLNALEEGEENLEVEKLSIERSKIDQYLFKIQSLAAQNQSLTLELMSDAEERTKYKQQIKKLEQENKKLKRELEEKVLQLELKHQQQKHEQYSNNIIADSNQEVIQMLRKQLIEQEQEHLDEKRKIQEKLEITMQQLNVAQDKITELQSEDIIGMSSNRKVHHQDCISINQHKNATQKLQMKLKSLEQRQTELQRQVLRSKYEFEELSRKYKKQEKEKQNLKVEYQKISTNRSQMILQKDAERIKIEILQAVKNKLKNRLEEEKKNNTK